jgi:23S rRNA (uracil1939-C5)-methyltransferase
LITVEKLVYGGDGLARDNGQVIMTPFVLPSEGVQVRIVEHRSQMLRALPESIETASPQRIAAPCKYFGECGGCHYQHAEYPYQAAQKVEILREVLRRVGKFQAPENIGLITGPDFGYRNRAQFHFDGKRFGYHLPESHRILDVDECPISSPRLQETLTTLRRMLSDRRFPNFLRTVELFTNETEVQMNVLASDHPLARRFFDWCAEEIPGFVSGPLVYAAAGFHFRVSHTAFFQVNRFLIEQLIEEALKGAEGETALDLYSGVGLFALPVASRFGNVTAVESGVAAWRDLEHNAAQANLGIFAHQTSAESYLTQNNASVDFVLADPPRAGLGKRMVQALLAAKPRRLTIVSCDPATLARDLAMLLPSYEIGGMTLIDLFPQTFHLETVVRLRLK